MSPRGQAMPEYSLLCWVLALALAVVASTPMPGGGGRTLVDVFLEAYQAYYNSFYFLLNLPFP